MTKKRKGHLPPDLPDPDDVESSMELIDEFVIVSSAADPETQAWGETTNQKWREIHHRRISAIQEVAAGRPIVREGRFRGNCFWHGILNRETSQFYVYELRHHESNELLGEARITKSKAHLEPCENCADHPQTRYTQGWID